MSEEKQDYATVVSIENTRLTAENARQAAEIAELRANLESAIALIHSYETSADAVRAVVKTLPQLIKQEARNA